MDKYMNVASLYAPLYSIYTKRVIPDDVCEKLLFSFSIVLALHYLCIE